MLQYIFTLANIIFLFLIIIQAPLLQHPSVSTSALSPSLEIEYPLQYLFLGKTEYQQINQLHLVLVMLVNWAQTD